MGKVCHAKAPSNISTHCNQHLPYQTPREGWEEKSATQQQAGSRSDHLFSEIQKGVENQTRNHHVK